MKTEKEIKSYIKEYKKMLAEGQNTQKLFEEEKWGIDLHDSHRSREIEKLLIGVRLRKNASEPVYLPKWARILVKVLPK